MAANLDRSLTLALRRRQQSAIIGGVGALFLILAFLPLLWPIFGLVATERDEIIRKMTKRME